MEKLPQAILREWCQMSWKEDPVINQLVSCFMSLVGFVEHLWGGGCCKHFVAMLKPYLGQMIQVDLHICFQQKTLKNTSLISQQAIVESRAQMFFRGILPV